MSRKAELEIVKFDVADVVTTSAPCDEDCGFCDGPPGSNL